jgi:mRNA interferase HigB
VVIAGRDKLAAFTKRHADARGWIASWIDDVSREAWLDMADVTRRYPSASILSGNRVVFNVKGNRYRMLTRVMLGVGTITVLRIGTHAEYDRWKL